jgi:hypothetical protein
MLFLLLFLAQQHHSVVAPTRPPAAGRPVYLCMGGNSYAYHATARFEGLAWCTTTLRTSTRAAAQKQGRYPCGRCRPPR